MGQRTAWAVTLAAMVALATVAVGQTTARAAGKVTYLRCGTLIDEVASQPRRNVTIAVQDGKIQGVGATVAPGAEVIDLSSQTCLPGLIDTHTHVLLQGDITAEDYDTQLLKQSAAYRVLLASRSARIALLNGFTTLRDLETEGAYYADVDLKKAINQGIVPGPRLIVATRSLNVTGAYPLQGYNWEIQVPHGVQFCDGADECRKAVREQISNGADWVKLYSDRSYYIDPNAPATPKPALNDVPTFTIEELKAIVDEAHRERRHVASHASAWHGVHNSLEAGVDSIEHGQYISDEDMKTMVQRGTWFVPTLFVGEYVAAGRAKQGAPVWLDMVKISADTFRRAVQAGVKIAFGTDAGGFDWSINEAKEFELRVKYGQTPAQALRSATADAAELLGMQDQIGTIAPGKMADIVAAPGDPLSDITVLEKVSFVMKGGEVYKK